MPDEAPLEPRFVLWRCDHCRNRIEFDVVQLAGRAACQVPCPHCGRETTLREPPPPPPLVPDEGWTQPVQPEIPAKPESEKLDITPPTVTLPTVVAEVALQKPAPEVALPMPVTTVTLPTPASPPPVVEKPVEEIVVTESPTTLVPKPIMVSLPPEPLPPTHTRAPVDVRWLTDLGVVYFRQHQFGEAFLCFSRAAQQGFATAQFCLSVCYFNGHGTPHDESAALPWLRAAAAQGDANAEFTLALAYSLGRGVAPDATQSANWMKQAAAHGHPEAIRRTRELAGSPAPRAETNLEKNSAPFVAPVNPPSSEKTVEKRRHDLQRLVLGLFKRK